MLKQLTACLMALVATALPAPIQQNLAPSGAFTITADDFSRGKSFVGVQLEPAISVLRIESSPRVEPPFGGRFVIIEQTPIVRVSRNYRFEIEISQECQLKVAVSQPSKDCRGTLDVLFSQPPPPQKDKTPSLIENIWGTVTYKVIKSEKYLLDPSARSFNGNVMLTVWFEPRQQWTDPGGHIIMKGRSTPLPFKYVSSNPQTQMLQGKRVTQYVFEYAQEDQVSAVRTTITITPVAKSR
jgi:hypothetical protein